MLPVDGTAGSGMDRTVRLEIRGRVQGVGFRWSMVQEARRAGVRGWVRNRRDGSVEAIAEGAPQAIDQLIDWARTGPPGARVDTVAVFDADPHGERFERFDQRPTA